MARPGEQNQSIGGAAGVEAGFSGVDLIQFIAEYTYSQNTWHDGATQHANSVALGTLFYW